MMQENEQQRVDLKRYMDKLLAAGRGGSAAGAAGTGSLASAEEFREVQEQLDVLGRENELLSQQVAALEAELRAMKEADGEHAARQAATARALHEAYPPSDRSCPRHYAALVTAGPP